MSASKIDPDKLRECYLEKGLSIKGCAKFFSCGQKAIYSAFAKYNIPQKKRKKRERDPPKHPRIGLTRDWIESHYRDEGLSIAQCAKLANCSYTGIYKAIRRFGIAPHPIGSPGPKNPNWRGGISFKPYCYKFDKHKKEEVRQRFGNKCYLCGMPQDQDYRQLAVHHCDYNKGQGCGSVWSLIPLCTNCHLKTNNHRWYWFNRLSNYWLDKYIDQFTF